MKKQVCLLLLALGVLNASGQKEYRVVLDMNTKMFNLNSIKDLQKIQKGDFYQVEIDNINRNLYNVAILVKDSIIKPEFNSIPTFKDLLTFTGFDEFASTKNLLESGGEQSVGAANAEKANTVNRQSKDTDTMKESILSEIKQLNNDVDAISNLYLAINQSQISYFMDEVTFNNKKYSPISVEKVMDESAKILRSVQQSIRSMENIKADGMNLNKKNPGSVTSDLINIVDSCLKKANALYSSFFTKIGSFTKNLLILENNGERKYLSLQRQFTSDICDLSIAIIPKDSAFHLSSYQTLFRFPRRCLTIGLGGAFYTAFFKNNSYSSCFAANDSTYKLIKENPSNQELGFATLLHLIIRPYCFPNWFALDCTFGPAISICENPRPRVAFGCGVSFGEKQSFSINLLGITGYVDRLRNSYNTTDSYSYKPSEFTIPTLALSCGFSIGYIYKF
jgi:hypothetical protein